MQKQTKSPVVVQQQLGLCVWPLVPLGPIPYRYPPSLFIHFCDVQQGLNSP